MPDAITFRWHPNGENDTRFLLGNVAATGARYCSLAWVSTGVGALGNSNKINCTNNSVIKNVFLRFLSTLISEKLDIYSDMNDINMHRILGNLDTTIVFASSSNMNNSNDTLEWNTLSVLGHQLVALLTGYMEHVDIESISKLLRTYNLKYDPGPAPTPHVIDDLVEVTITASPADVTTPVPIVDVVSCTGSLDEVVAAADALLRQLLRPVFGDLPVEPVTVDLIFPPAVRHALSSVDLVGMLISVVAANNAGRRTDSFSPPLHV